jgi:hypothetical protein
MRDFSFFNGSGATPGAAGFADYSAGLGIGGGYTGNGGNGRVVITIDGTKYYFDYTGSPQTFRIRGTQFIVVGGGGAGGGSTAEGSGVDSGITKAVAAALSASDPENT